MPGWRKIETAPKDGKAVLAWRAGWTPISTYWSKNWERWQADCCNRPVAPTHWMPLPEPPEAESSCGCTNGCKAWGCDK